MKGGHSMDDETVDLVVTAGYYTVWPALRVEGGPGDIVAVPASLLRSDPEGAPPALPPAPVVPLKERLKLHLVEGNASIH